MSKLGDAFRDWLDGGKDSADNAKPEDAAKKPDEKEKK